MWKAVPEGYTMNHGAEYCEVNSFGRMNTFKAPPSTSYTVTIRQIGLGSALQLGFCDESFVIPASRMVQTQKGCSLVYFGCGDDTQKKSVAHDPVRKLNWVGGQSTGAGWQVDANDVLTIKNEKGKTSIYKDGNHVTTIQHALFNKACPCVSIQGNVTVRLSHTKMTMIKP